MTACAHYFAPNRSRHFRYASRLALYELNSLSTLNSKQNKTERTVEVVCRGITLRINVTLAFSNSNLHPSSRSAWAHEDNGRHTHIVMLKRNIRTVSGAYIRLASQGGSRVRLPSFLSPVFLQVAIRGGSTLSLPLGVSQLTQAGGARTQHSTVLPMAKWCVAKIPR